MEKFTTHTGTGVPLRRSNVDTDQIIPAVFLKRITRTGFEDGLFSAWRRDPNFILNNPDYEAGSILIAGPDFGTGSSREHAVWALQDYGFKVVLSPKFGDIFRSNAGKAGLVAGAISPEDGELLWKLVEENPAVPLTVSLDDMTVTCGAVTVPFALDDYTRWRLREGLDDIGLTMRDEESISAFEKTRPSWKPQTLPAQHSPSRG